MSPKASTPKTTMSQATARGTTGRPVSCGEDTLFSPLPGQRPGSLWQNTNSVRRITPRIQGTFASGRA